MTLRTVDRVRYAIREQCAVGQSGKRIGDALDGDVPVRSLEPGRPTVVGLGGTSAHHPTIQAVLMAQAVAGNELAAVCPNRLDLAQQVTEILGMYSFKPHLRGLGGLVIAAAHESKPSRGEMNPVGDQIPVPESLVVFGAHFVPIRRFPFAGRTRKRKFAHLLRIVGHQAWPTLSSF